MDWIKILVFMVLRLQNLEDVTNIYKQVPEYQSIKFFNP